MNKGYPNDLTDKEWEVIKHFFERPDPRGNKGYHSKRIIVNAIFYVIKSNGEWFQMIYHFGKQFMLITTGFASREFGSRYLILNELSKRKLDRNVESSYTIVDPQNIKTQYDSEERVFDGGKKGKGKKKAYIGRYYRQYALYKSTCSKYSRHKSRV